jgi:hypothetical protein
MARARADLQRLAGDLADEIADLRRELTEAKAVRAIDSAVRTEREITRPLS